MEFGSIEREVRIEASPEVVFDVVSSPEHIRDWWNAETDVAAVPGAAGELLWRDGDTGATQTVQYAVVDAVPPRLFSFRWTHEPDQPATDGNSLLVTFELVPSGEGTLLRMTETGFRERGWEVAVLEEQYRDHTSGWDHFLPRIAARALELVSP